VSWIHGKLLKVLETRAGTGLLFLVGYGKSAVTETSCIRVFCFDLETSQMTDTDIRVNVQINPGDDIASVVQIGVGPVLEVVGTDHVYILVYGTVHVYSLTTSQEVKVVDRADWNQEKIIQNASSIAVTKSGVWICAPSAASLFSLSQTDNNSASDKAMTARICNGSGNRLHTAPPELRIPI
jgi:hypothetical protein